MTSMEKKSFESRRHKPPTPNSGSEGSKYGGEVSLPPPPALTEQQERNVWRKVDLRLLPILSLLYLFCFLDRKNIGNAKLEGLITQLGLQGHQYNIVLMMHTIPFCLFECPSNLLLKRLRPSRWLPSLTVVWGIVATLMGIVKNYPHLVVMRVLLGISEAGLFPGVVYYLTLWYPREKLQTRIGLFFGAASLSGAFSGLLAYGISFMGGTHGLLGWSWIFILEGCATVGVGLLAFFVLVDFPETVTFLAPEERSFVVHKKKFDMATYREEENFALRHIVAAVTDWQIWLHILVYSSIMVPEYGMSVFLPSIINDFGYSTAVSQTLSIPPYICAFVVLYVFARYSDKLGMRSPFIVAGLMLNLIGFSINISKAPPGVKYFGTFLVVIGSYSAFPGVISWLGNNLAGQYKRGVGMAMQIGIGNLSGIVAANIFREKDRPRYILGYSIELMFVGIGLVTVPIIVIIYARIHTKRAAILQDMQETGRKYSEQELREMGDRAPDFRYML